MIMSDNKLKTFFLISALTLFGGITSCEKDDDTQLKQETPKEIVLNPIQKQEYFNHVRDSIRQMNGYDTYTTQLATHRPSDYDKEDIKEIKNSGSLGGSMTRQVRTQGVKIINCGYEQIASSLRKDRVYLDDVIKSDDCEFKIIKNRGAKEEIVFISKANMAFFGVGTKTQENQDVWVARETKGAFDRLASAIFYTIDNSEIDVDKKQTLKKYVVSSINKIKFDLNANRRKIEQEYSDYYLIDDYDKKHLGIDGYEFGYLNLNNPEINGEYCMTHKCSTMHVNGTEANGLTSFLQDSSAQYVAVKNGAKAYDIIRKSKNGDVAIKTIPANTTFGSRYHNISNNLQPNLDSIDFEFELDTNNNIQLFFDEIVNIKSRKKYWNNNLSKDAEKKIDSLNKEIKRKEELVFLIMKTERHADSVANEMLKQKINQR